MTDHTPERVDTHGQVAAVEEPIPNPGLAPHEPRPTDVDPAAEKRAERQVAAFFVLSMLATVSFVVCYFVFEVDEGDGQLDLLLGRSASHVTLGLSLGIAFLALGVGVIQWARKLMSDQEIVEYRHPAHSSDEDREHALGQLRDGAADSGIGRRPLLRNTMIGALGMLGVPVIVGLRDLGPLPDVENTLEKTFWEAGTRIVNDVTGRPLRPSDLEVGTLVNAEPEGLVPTEVHREGVEYPEGVDLQVARSKAAVIVVRMEPKDVTEETLNWGVDGIVAYSKICTHVGCPISLWEQQTHHLLCPCHQSTFDLADKGRVIFGPAGRALPQLPIEVGPDGYLVAQSDFHEPVGPSYWERG